jgi:pimeloyl-ACP methyl ester carboxylesterase
MRADGHKKAEPACWRGCVAADHRVARLLLIHGGAHGAWCWERMLEPLRAAGHAPEAVDMPGRGADAGRASTVTLDDYTQHLHEVIARGHKPLAIVAHSMGGVYAWAIAERRPDAISRIIFLASLTPRDGEAGLPILQTRGAGSALLEPGAIVVAEDQTTAYIPAEHATASFYYDCDPDDAAWAAPQLCDEPLAPIMTPVHLTDAGYGRVPKTWILTTKDRTVPPLLQREQAESIGAEIVELDGGHSPFLSAPEALTPTIDSVL